MDGRHAGLNVGFVQICADEGSFELPVDFVSNRVAIGVRPGPAVVLNGGVQRLGGVPDVVPQPSRIEDRCLLDVVDKPEGGVIAWIGPREFYERVGAVEDRRFYERVGAVEDRRFFVHEEWP